MRVGASMELLVCSLLLLQPRPVVGQVAQAPLFTGTPVGPGCDGGAGTAPALSSSTLTDGSLFVRSGFFSRTWEGYVTAYAAKDYLGFLGGRSGEPAPAWTANFPPPATRNIHTSSTQATPIAFDWCSLAADQRTLVEPVYATAHSCPVDAPPIMAYLRGDATDERRNGGVFRDRPNTVLGDVVNSTPLLSRATDHAYHLAPAASGSSSGAPGHAGYRNYVEAKKSGRM
ncbi:MAG TPA: hypothetical protein VFN64_01030, partial [Burkholderiaceae bacterium]|nr:hypothetical protein [Burkholderiaceae bacterium]